MHPHLFGLAHMPRQADRERRSLSRLDGDLVGARLIRRSCTPDSCPSTSQPTLAQTANTFFTPLCMHNASRERFPRLQLHLPCRPPSPLLLGPAADAPSGAIDVPASRRFSLRRPGIPRSGKRACMPRTPGLADLAPSHLTPGRSLAEIARSRTSRRTVDFTQRAGDPRSSDLEYR